MEIYLCPITIALTLQDILDRTRAALQQVIVSDDEMELLQTDVETQLEVPDWFRDHTRLCFRWATTVNGDTQCSGQDFCMKTERRLCVWPCVPHLYTVIPV